MLERSSKAVFKELMSLLTEYQNAVEEENDINNARINERIGGLEAEIYRLKSEVYNLKDKSVTIAHLLLED